jgi:hypothetical protein
MMLSFFFFLLRIVQSNPRDGWWMDNRIGGEIEGYTYLSIGINLEGSMDGRLEWASESRRDGLRLLGPEGGAMMGVVYCEGG